MKSRQNIKGLYNTQTNNGGNALFPVSLSRGKTPERGGELLLIIINAVSNATQRPATATSVQDITTPKPAAYGSASTPWPTSTPASTPTPTAPGTP